MRDEQRLRFRRSTPGQQACRTGKDVAQTADLTESAAGQQRDHTSSLGQAQLSPRRSAIDLQWDLIGQRMADELGVYRMAGIKGRLERQQA